MVLLPVLLLLACEPEPAAPGGPVFPEVYTPEDDLEPWESVRWETESWDPLADLDQAAMYLIKAVRHRRGAPVESLEHFAAQREAVPPLRAGDPTLSLVGDVMWLGGGWGTAFGPAAGLLDGDLRLGNLETPTSDALPTEQGALGLYAFNAPSALLDDLALDLVQVNNNHSLDAGDGGLEDTLAALDARGIAWTGVDTHRVVEVRGVSVGVLSYTWGLNVRDVQSAHELFVVPFGHPGPVDLDRVREDVLAIRDQGAELIVVMVHWGYEYEYYADPHFLVQGRGLVAAGADLVVGSGPHVAQPVEVCAVDQGVAPGVGRCAVTTEDRRPRTAAIVYSLANFGASPTLTTPETSGGLVVTASFDPSEGITGLGWAAVARGPGPTVVPLTSRTDAEALAEQARLEAHLGTGWMR